MVIKIEVKLVSPFYHKALYRFYRIIKPRINVIKFLFQKFINISLVIYGRVILLLSWDNPDFTQTLLNWLVLEFHEILLDEGFSIQFFFVSLIPLRI